MTSWLRCCPWITHSGQTQFPIQSKQKYEISSSGWSLQNIFVLPPVGLINSITFGYIAFYRWTDSQLIILYALFIIIPHLPGHYNYLYLPSTNMGGSLMWMEGIMPTHSIWHIISMIFIGTWIMSRLALIIGRSEIILPCFVLESSSALIIFFGI